MNWWIVWIIFFLIVIFAVSIVSSRKIKTSDDFIMADFTLGFFPITGTVIATVTGSAAIIGASGKGFEMGISYIITALSFTTFTILFTIILGPTIRKLRLYTIPDLFVKRFGKASALLPAMIIGLLYMTPTFSMQLVGMGSILTSITDISVTWGIIIGFIISVIFTLMGGMYSVAWTDTIQTFFIIAGVVLMFILTLRHVGGAEVIIEQTPEHYFNFFSIGGIELLNWFLVFGPFYIVWQTTWQRISAAKSAKTATWSISVGFIISALLSFLAVIIGIIALQEMPADTKPDQVYTLFMVDIFPAPLGGLFMVSLLAALLTGATSFLLSGAINIAKDIYQSWIDEEVKDEKLLKVSRFSVLGMAVIGLMIALYITDIIGIYQYALTFTAVTLVAPVLAAMFWKRATKTGVIVSVIGSMIVSFIWRVAGQPFGVHEILPGLIVSFVLLIIISLATKHSADEDVVAYFYALKNEKDPQEVDEKAV